MLAHARALDPASRRGSRHRPAPLLTTDFEASLSAILRRSVRRWLVEQSISEQLAFFHLNRRSSSTVIMVDFDLTITILAYYLLRFTTRSLYDRLLCNGSAIELAPDV